MSTDEANNNFFADFLEDYFAESDEHLTIVRRNLLVLETFVENPQIPGSLLDELFRSFHTLKGLSGMVGVKEAEQLAHEMESYLRALREAELVLSTEGMDALIGGTKMLEEVIAAKHSQEPLPNVASAISQLLAVIPDPTLVKVAQKPNSSEESNLGLSVKQNYIDRLDAAIKRGDRIWKFEFLPASNLAERGINVSSIRDRLQKIGELIHSAPRVLKGGGVAFDFIIATQADETTFSQWDNDGLTWEVDGAGMGGQGDEGKKEEIHPSSLKTENSSLTQNALRAATLTKLKTQNSFVRVDLNRLDDLMRMVGELVIGRSRLEDNLARLNGTISQSQMRPLKETNLALERQLRELREGVMRVRLVPIGEVFARMQFVVRDITRETQKQVNLELSGQETEIDKFVVERMMEPLLHLVRNAVSHGLETKSERLAKGKPAVGRLVLRASTAGEMVVIEIEDDGRGIDVENVTKRARALNLISEATSLDSTTILDIICSSGFSTREQADLTSGRGVGMAVVKNTVLELGGELMLDMRVDAGTRFRIELPLTLAIADALILSVGGQTFAIPQSSVREVIEVQSHAITQLQNNEILAFRGKVLPLIRLARLFGLEDKDRKSGELAADSQPLADQNAKLYAIVVGNALDLVGIIVDRIRGQQEIVVRSLTDPLVQVPGISGATELGDGQVVLILDAAKLKSQKEFRLLREF